MKVLHFYFTVLIVLVLCLESNSQNFNATNIKLLPVDKVNTIHSEFGAIEYEDLIIYCSNNPGGKKSKKGDKVYGIYVKNKNAVNNNPNKLFTFNKRIFSDTNEGPVFISYNGNKLYYTVSSKKVDKNTNLPQLEVYESKRTKSGWGPPKRASFNDVKGSTAYATVSNNGNIIVFASNRSGSKSKLLDLWMINTNSKSEKKSIQNLALINTESTESYPFLDVNGNLYFSSDRQGTFGRLDVYVVKDFTKGKREVKHLPKPLNSQFDDYSLSYYPNNNYGYVTSNRIRRNVQLNSAGAEDIFRFSFDQALTLAENETEYNYNTTTPTYQEIFKQKPKTQPIKNKRTTTPKSVAKNQGKKYKTTKESKYNSYDEYLRATRSNPNSTPTTKSQTSYSTYKPTTSTGSTSKTKSKYKFSNLNEYLEYNKAKTSTPTTSYTPTSSTKYNRLQYRIQIAAFSTPTDSIEKNLIKQAKNYFPNRRVYDESHGGYKKYLIGDWNNLQDARNALQYYKRGVSKNAFIVEYKNGYRSRIYLH